MGAQQKRRIPGVMATSVRSVSSPALIVAPTADSDAKIDFTVDIEGVPTCQDVIDLLKLKEKKALYECVIHVARKVLPGWEQVQDIKLDRVSGAMTNAVYFLDSPGKSRVLLRIYGVGADQIVDRQRELAWLSRLSQISNNVSPQLLATFGNGRFEEYLDSTTLTHAELSDPTTSCQIAQALRQLHSLVEDYPPPTTSKGVPLVEIWRNITQWYTAVRELMNQDVWKVKFEDFHLESLPAEIERCKAIMERFPSPTVFAHNDTQYGNVLRLTETGELVIVDFEYAGYNPLAFDLANHFVEWMYNYHGDHPAEPIAEYFPSKEQRWRFLNAYIGDEPIGQSVEELDECTLAWTTACHLQWALWGVIQYSQSEIDYDYHLYSKSRFDAFRKQLAIYS
ncbi:hypothetical protein LRAMOSA08256 [Lichtheimia ramosa]|uniref:Choline kinase N-terminal domain-containing protein n=1 Tax=Lichtheimia ramosa TaxID=688394 RepID=A0A077WF33_9FUNG|nr:hypothetical protein LRAMOSA08256 [Lichtheimia ramosa]